MKYIFIGLIIVIIIILVWHHHHQWKPRAGSLYERLGGVYAIAAVVNDFSDAILQDGLVGNTSPNKQLREWSVNQAPGRLAGLKFQRTLWMCQVTGGPQVFVRTHPEPSALNLQNAHCPLQINSNEFDRVAKILGDTLDKYGVGTQEKNEVLAAFGAHKGEVIYGASTGGVCPFS